VETLPGLTSHTMPAYYMMPATPHRLAAGQGHTDHVLAVAISGDSMFLASGGRDKQVFVWRFEDFKLLRKFTVSVEGAAYENRSIYYKSHCEIGPLPTLLL